MRYMIIEHSDLIRDLQYWETLSVSSLMLRPINVIYNQEWFERDSEMQEAFHQNRVSGLSYALLTTANQKDLNGCKKTEKGSKCCTVEIPEKQLYRTLLDVTHYKSRGLRLMDYEDTDIVVDE
jgi:Phosphatidate cytidylyltransferase, mitochondrial